MVQAHPEDAPVTFEQYMARYEGSNVYFSKLNDFANSGRMPIEIRGKAINLAVSKAKALKKIG